ncbi:AbrB/MazE/SpoVT family DNA-binding domain-containing protein [Candidatus Woesearchaeota archaeon]|nr:AbrB/MazE/SpoVT family DNA-binding domain-containing protein [Candidatus Woesearchaeota archaeon]
MRRKVIQIADSTQLVSLPRKWALKYGIKKGDEIEVEEKGSSLVISTEKGREKGSIEIDISNLDRDSLMFLIRCLYIKGYDEIKLNFTNTTAPHHKKSEAVSVMSAIYEEVRRISGLEVISHEEHSCTIKDIAQGSISEFDVVLRRIILLMLSAINDLYRGSTESNSPLLESINDKHDTLTKFISYNMRLLNKYTYPQEEKNTSLYTTLSSLDEVIDIVKYTARYLLALKGKLSDETASLMTDIAEELKLYSDFFYKYDLKILEKISGNRTKIMNKIAAAMNKITKQETFVLVNLGQILEIITHLTLARITMEH